jgi:hypothetical protein
MSSSDLASVFPLCPGLVKEVMGHESLTMTMGYLHPETAQSKVVIGRLKQQKYVM